MTNSQIRGRFGAALVVGLGLVLSSASLSHGQDEAAAEATRPSSEDEAEDASGAPVSLFSDVPEEDTQQGPSSGSGPRQGSIRSLPPSPGSEDAVTVGTLSAVNIVPIGTLRLADGGFGLDMWAGTQPLVVESLISQLPTLRSSPLVRDLSRRLLLTRTYDPEGATSGKSLSALRIERLYAAGLIDDALAVANTLPQSGNGPSVLKIRSKIYLLQDNTNEACVIAARMRTRTDDIYWAKLRTFCYLVVGDVNAASLSSDLIAEQGDKDPNFFTLVANLAYEAGLPTDEIAATNPLHWALLKLAGEEFPQVALTQAPLPMLVHVAQASVEPVAQTNDANVLGLSGPAPDALMRLNALELAVQSGAIPVETLRDVYQTYQVPNDLQSEQPVHPSLKSAALYQAAFDGQSPDVRAASMVEAIADSDARNLGAVLPFLYRDVLRTIPANGVLENYAAQFAPLLIQAGLLDEADAWLQLMDDQVRDQVRVGGGGALADDLRAYRSVIQVLKPEAKIVGLDWNAIARLSGTTNDAQYRRAVVEVRMFEALGHRIPDEARLLILERPVQMIGQMPQPTILANMDSASRAGRVGETVLYLLVALGAEGPGKAHPTVLYQGVSSLMRIGFEEEARLLAAEALLAVR